MNDKKELTIRNSTAEFLIFEKQAHADSIEVRYEDETLWLTQKMMSNLFDVSTKTISEHLANIYDSGELDRDPTVRKFRIVQSEGLRQVARDIEHYNLDAVISVGYRVNSIRATQFRRWATQVLKQYAITGYPKLFQIRGVLPASIHYLSYIRCLHMHNRSRLWYSFAHRISSSLGYSAHIRV